MNGQGIGDLQHRPSATGRAVLPGFFRSYWIKTQLESRAERSEVHLGSFSELPGFPLYSVLASRNLHTHTPTPFFTWYRAYIFHISTWALPREPPPRLPERIHIPTPPVFPPSTLLTCVLLLLLCWRMGCSFARCPIKMVSCLKLEVGGVSSSSSLYTPGTQ